MSPKPFKAAEKKFLVDDDALRDAMTVAIQKRRTHAVMAELELSDNEFARLPAMVQLRSDDCSQILSTIDLLKYTGRRFVSAFLSEGDAGETASERRALCANGSGSAACDKLKRRKTSRPSAPSENHTETGAPGCNAPPDLPTVQLAREDVPALRLVLDILEAQVPSMVSLQEIVDIMRTAAFIGAEPVMSGIYDYIEPLEDRLKATEVLQLVAQAVAQYDVDLASGLMRWLAREERVREVADPAFAAAFWRALRPVVDGPMSTVLLYSVPPGEPVHWMLSMLAVISCDGACDKPVLGSVPPTPDLGVLPWMLAEHGEALLEAMDWRMACPCQRGVGRALAATHGTECVMFKQVHAAVMDAVPGEAVVTGSAGDHLAAVVKYDLVSCGVYTGRGDAVHVTPWVHSSLRGAPKFRLQLRHTPAADGAAGAASADTLSLSLSWKPGRGWPAELFKIDPMLYQVVVGVAPLHHASLYGLDAALRTASQHTDAEDVRRALPYPSFSASRSWVSLARTSALDFEGVAGCMDLAGAATSAFFLLAYMFIRESDDRHGLGGSSGDEGGSDLGTNDS